MTIHPLAGQPAPPSAVIDIGALCRDYYTRRPDVADGAQRVKFGTSGHRGSSLEGAFNEAHILAITQAICDHRKHHGIDGPLFLARDTHALSEPALRTALEVLAANGVDVMIDPEDGAVPTPLVSHAILGHNRAGRSPSADGIVMTPSHNPPVDGGVKYSPPSGGPAGPEVTRWIEGRANHLLTTGIAVGRTPYERARHASTTHPYDYVSAYVRDVGSVIDTEVIRRAAVVVGVDPLGGAAMPVWGPLADRYGLNLKIVNAVVDPTFRFMPLDWDGRIRMDCSSPYAMAALIRLRDRFDVACGTDTDADRHGIVTRSGLMNPNHYLAVAVSYLFRHRPEWPVTAGVGKTIVSSSIIDRVARAMGRTLVEVPVGFKWFVSGLLGGSLGIAGEESAGASLLRRDGTTWTTDKDGIVMCLLAAEIMARSGRDLSELYRDLTGSLGDPVYERIDTPASADEAAALLSLAPEDVVETELAGDPIQERLTTAPGNGSPIGGIKVVSDHGWFAARPSGTEPVYKLYAESFRGPEHLRRIQDDARAIVNRVRAGMTR